MVHSLLPPLGCSTISGIPVRLWPLCSELDGEASLSIPGTKEAKEGGTGQTDPWVRWEVRAGTISHSLRAFP